MEAMSNSLQLSESCIPPDALFAEFHHSIHILVFKDVSGFSNCDHSLKVMNDD